MTTTPFAQVNFAARDVPEAKLCSACAVEKPASEFGRDRRMATGLKSWCRPCGTEANKRYYHQNLDKSRQDRRERVKRSYSREKGRHRHLLAKYRLSVEAYADLKASQDGRCAICKADEPGGVGDWHVDHDHATNAVRGLLCSSCNVGLGHFKDNPERLKAAASYLEKHKEQS